MKPNELQIGDWVNFLIDVEGGDTENDPKNVVYQPMQVDSISSLDEVSSAFYGVTNDAAQLRPIPLTAEILEKNGFIGGEYKSPITDEEWNYNAFLKYVIERRGDIIIKNTHEKAYHFLAFHTNKQLDLFLKENEDLVKDYLMID